MRVEEQLWWQDDNVQISFLNVVSRYHAAVSPRPGRIDTEIEVPFPRPRATSIGNLAEFQSIVQRLRERLEAIT